MFSLETAHSRNNYLREFAYKTVTGIDIPYSDGHLPELKRLRYYPVTNDNQLQRMVKRYSNRPGEYISVYAYERLVPHIRTGKLCIDYNTAKINRLYLDFDSDDSPQYAIFEALLTVRALVKHNIFCHCYFSGNRGIALYIEFVTTEIKPENKKGVIGAFFDLVVDTVKEEYEDFFGMAIKSTHSEKNNQIGYVMTTIDYTVWGDIARVSRIPNTKHKSGLYCIPLTFGDMYRGIEHIKALAKTPRDYDLETVIVSNTIRNHEVPVIIRSLEKQVIADRQHSELEKEIAQHRRESYLNTHKNTPGRISDEDIQKAKSMPLSRIIGTAEERIKCPIHRGDNPTSLQINHDTGLWFCHSCRRGGDGISYIMERNNVDFTTAVTQILEGG